MTCRTCENLVVDRTKETVRKGKVYACGFAPPFPLLPDSMTSEYNFKWPPNRRWMEPDDGAQCPCYRPRGMGEDLVWIIDKRIRELTPIPAEKAA